MVIHDNDVGLLSTTAHARDEARFELGTLLSEDNSQNVRRCVARTTATRANVLAQRESPISVYATTDSTSSKVVDFLYPSRIGEPLRDRAGSNRGNCCGLSCRWR
jgi:hypothetical protein